MSGEATQVAPGDAKASKKKGKKAKTAPGAPSALSIRSHPRAARSVRRTRATAGLLGFAITLLLSISAGVPDFDAVARALVAGMVLNLVSWSLAVAVWRQLIIGEVRALHAKRMERRQAAIEAAEAAVAAS